MNPKRTQDGAEMRRALENAWRREVAAARVYRALAAGSADSRRAELFRRLAASEERHAERFLEQLMAHGGAPRPDSHVSLMSERLMTRLLGSEGMLRHMEALEERNIARYQRNAHTFEGPVRNLFAEVEEEEKAHSKVLQGILPPSEARSRLDALLRREKWHVSTGSWIGDAIYGVNDGLGAVFGIVTGMSGYSGGGHVVLIAGLTGMMASALSMGSGAYLASKSEREVHQAEMARERREIEEDPEHEREELELIYQLKGFNEAEARMLADRVVSQPDQFLKIMAQEELGLTEQSLPDPLAAMATASLSTAVGAFIPIVPFMFLHGLPAIIASAIISTLAHFAVGAAKCLVTARSWLASGLEMTFVGLLEAALTYSLGLALGRMH